MIQRVIKLFWLALFAMVLPAQAVAYLAQAESDIGARLTHSISNANQLSQADAQALFDASREEKESSSRPVSQSEGSVDVVAIINLNRWGMSGRHIDESDINETDSYLADVNQLPPHKLYCHPILAKAYWADNAFSANHRISGWKDSNALYVALNSQFA
tara:strand:- start:2979 stop:3455 length:477 start_codon:yes stop_codon:yes gene_type:complete